MSISNVEGLFWNDLVELMRRHGNPNLFVTVALPGIETYTTRVVGANVDLNTDGEPGGVLWLHLEDATAEAAANGIEDADDAKHSG